MVLILMDQALARPLYHDLANKAAQDNAALTEAERKQLLHLPDPQNPLYRKALAYPETITPEERLEILGWPSEDVRRANVALVTDGIVQDPEQFLACAAKDVSWMNLAHAKLLLNEFHIAEDEVGEYKNMVRYRCTVAPARLRFRSNKKAAAQRLVMTETERTAYQNAVDVYCVGMNVGKRMAMLRAGELDSQAAELELKMHRKARKRYSEDKRKQNRGLVPRRPIVSLPPYFPPQSDEDLYLIYCAERDREWLKSMVENKTEYGFAIYRTKQIRTAHETVPAELQRDVARFLNEDRLKRALGNVLHMYRVQDPNLGNSFNNQPELLYGTVPVTFDMFWTRYLHFMMPRATADGLAGKASPGWMRRLHDSELAKKVRYQAVEDIEVSEDDPGMDETLRQHFKNDLVASTVINSRYFIVCTSDGTPSIVDAFKSSTEATVWVYDAEWKAKPDDLDDNEFSQGQGSSYKGKIKTAFDWSLFSAFYQRLMELDFDLEEAWEQIHERDREGDNTWDLLY